jgi:V8-like Glu-specific endopeptidase
VGSFHGRFPSVVVIAISSSQFAGWQRFTPIKLATVRSSAAEGEIKHIFLFFNLNSSCSLSFSLVSTKIIVTAAHCVLGKSDYSPRKAEESYFYIGKYDLTTLNQETNYILANVAKFEIHPEWDKNSKNFDADVALAILGRKIPFSNFVQPICLWTSTSSYEDLVGKEVTVAGWGRSDQNASEFRSTSF